MTILSRVCIRFRCWLELRVSKYPIDSAPYLSNQRFSIESNCVKIFARAKVRINLNGERYPRKKMKYARGIGKIKKLYFI